MWCESSIEKLRPGLTAGAPNMGSDEKRLEEKSMRGLGGAFLLKDTTYKGCKLKFKKKR